jgi:hypothetical protein
MGRKKAGITKKTNETKSVEAKVEAQVKKLEPKVLKKEIYNSSDIYLISSGEKPTRIPYMVKWAEQRGYTIATNEQWKEIFAEF